MTDADLDQGLIEEYEGWLRGKELPERAVVARLQVVAEFRQWSARRAQLIKASLDQGGVEVVGFAPMPPVGRPAGKSPGPTSNRVFRIPDDLYTAAKAAAAERGETLSAVIRRGLENYINDRPQPPTAA